VRRAGRRPAGLDPLISTHAPAKGATAALEHHVLALCISTHAPAKGATSAPHAAAGGGRHFNPRTREGCDLTSQGFANIYLHISTHAPAKGATRIENKFDSRSCSFQPTHPRRVRRHTSALAGRPADFNPRTREGCDGGPTTTRPACSHFNPRTREGCDTTSPVSPQKSISFQPTHPRRVRPERRKQRVEHRRISTHAPAKGATRYPVPFHPTCGFQPTHPRRVRRRRRAPHGSRRADFNPRTREGCDSPASIDSNPTREFQPTHPRRVRLQTIRINRSPISGSVG